MMRRSSIAVLLVSTFLALNSFAEDGFPLRMVPFRANVATVSSPAGGGLTEDFSDGDYTSNPTWNAVGVSNASWGVSGGRAVLAASGDYAFGLLETAATFTESASMIVNQGPNESTTVVLKACETEPAYYFEESGCYTATLDLPGSTTLPPPPMEPCFEKPYLLTLYRGATSIGSVCVAGPLSGDFTLSLSVSGGTVTADAGSGTATVAVSDSTYRAFTFVGFGASGGVDTSAPQFDDILAE